MAQHIYRAVVPVVLHTFGIQVHLKRFKPRSQSVIGNSRPSASPFGASDLGARFRDRV